MRSEGLTSNLFELRINFPAILTFQGYLARTAEAELSNTVWQMVERRQRSPNNCTAASL
jgi:hypothetical protein